MASHAEAGASFLAVNPLLRLPAMSTDLARVEEELLRSVKTDDELLTEIASHLIRAGGKRLRPGFCLAASCAHQTSATAASKDAVTGGVSVELVHLGSLYHDDVMDEALTRRTVDSVNARWGNLKAILGGDFLLAKASELAAGLGTEVAGLLAATIARLCEGQVRELQNMFNVGRTEQAYLAAISGKTAALFSSACRIGGLVAGHPRDVIDRLTTFGDHYGMAFQIVDDILDVVATDEQLGKPSGNDLVQGVYTLPVIRTLVGNHGADLRAMLGQPLDIAQMNVARDLVRSNGAIGSSIDAARAYIEQAIDALRPLGETPAALALQGAAQHLLASIPTVPAA